MQRLVKEKDIESLEALRDALNDLIPVFKNENATDQETAEALGAFIVAVARVTQ